MGQKTAVRVSVTSWSAELHSVGPFLEMVTAVMGVMGFGAVRDLPVDDTSRGGEKVTGDTPLVVGVGDPRGKAECMVDSWQPYLATLIEHRAAYQHGAQGGRFPRIKPQLVPPGWEELPDGFVFETLNPSGEEEFVSRIAICVTDRPAPTDKKTAGLMIEIRYPTRLQLCALLGLAHDIPHGCVNELRIGA